MTYEVMVEKEAQNSRKGGHVHRKPGFLCHPLLVGYLSVRLEKIYFPFRRVNVVPVCLLAESVSP